MGIGITEPQFKLDIAGTTRANFTNSPAFQTQTPLGVVIQQANINNDFNSSLSFLSIFGHNIRHDGTNWIRRNHYSSAWATVMNTTYYDVRYAPNGTGTVVSDAPVTPSTYLRIAESGNVGIGTTTPTQKLDVNGSVKFSGGDGLSFGVGPMANINRIQTSATGPSIRFLNTGDSYANVGMGRLSIGGSYANQEAPIHGALIEGNVGLEQQIPRGINWR